MNLNQKLRVIAKNIGAFMITVDYMSGRINHGVRIHGYVSTHHVFGLEGETLTQTMRRAIKEAKQKGVIR